MSKSRRLPEDIQPEWLQWFNVFRRLQSVTQYNHGFAIVNMQVLINSDGKPVCWLEPTLKRIEPSSSTTELFALMIAENEK
jgi:hypothetical protein